MDAILVLLVVVLAAVAGAREAARLFDLMTGADDVPRERPPRARAAAAAVRRDGDDVVTSRLAA
jgi:hypothetical protein